MTAANTAPAAFYFDVEDENVIYRVTGAEQADATVEILEVTVGGIPFWLEVRDVNADYLRPLPADEIEHFAYLG